MAMAGDEILDAIDRADAMGARSTLSLWMRENHDGFAARLAVRRADWTVLAALFEKAGLTDGEGKTASAETARKTWHRVRQHMARVRAGLPGTSPEPAYIGQSANTSAAGAAGSADLPVEPPQPERAASTAAGDPAVVASHPPARPRNSFTVARFKRSTEEPT
jgi:hypothetical protein